MGNVFPLRLEKDHLGETLEETPFGWVTGYQESDKESDLKRNWLLLGISSTLVLGLLGSPVLAEHWTFLGKHPEGDMYLDTDSISHHDALTSFWVRRHYNKPQESKISKMKFREQWVFQSLDCQKNTMQLNQMVFMDDKGKAVGAYMHLKEPPKAIQPQGFFAKEAKLLCMPGAGKTNAAGPKVTPSASPGQVSKSAASKAGTDKAVAGKGLNTKTPERKAAASKAGPVKLY